MNTQVTQQQLNALAQAAAAIKKYSYSPYSKFKVGAAVLAEDGTIFPGTNIENASYGLTVCAERNALFKGVGEGRRKFIALAVCTDPVPGSDFGAPCGACRQVMTEFMDQDAVILLVSVLPNGELKTCRKTLADFMPYPFEKFGA